MAETIYKTIFQVRRGSSSEWTSINPVLRVGEPGYDTTIKKLKIGDGTTPWINLPFQGESIADFDFIDCGNSSN